MDKHDRHLKILQIIRDNTISTQEELLLHLRAFDLEVTQATISRDINELNIIKASLANGKQKFVAMKSKYDAGSSRLLKVFSEAVIGYKLASNLIVIYTLPGMAPACASAIDVLSHPDIAGSIAGDDTIFVAVDAEASLEDVSLEIMQYANIE